MVNLLKRTLASWPGASALEQLDALLRAFSLSEALPLFASLLDLPLSVRPPLPAMPPERQREQTLEALVALLLEMSEREPVILLAEDLHWLDASTLAWLERLIDQTATAPLLLVMTIRPNTLDIPWGSRARVTQLTLGALDPRETERLILLLSGGQPLRPEVQQHIVAQTDGVPLFVEELTRSALEAGDSGEWRELPATLRDSLTARLGRLGTAKEVAQLAPVIGRAFPLKLLTAVASHSVVTLDARCAVWCSPVSSTGVVSAPRPAIPSSTRSSATRRTTPCCGASASRSICASRPRWTRRSAPAAKGRKARKSPTTTWLARSRPRLRCCLEAGRAGDRPLGPYRSDRTLPARAASP